MKACVNEQRNTHTTDTEKSAHTRAHTSASHQDENSRKNELHGHNEPRHRTPVSPSRINFLASLAATWSEKKHVILISRKQQGLN